MIGYNTEQDLIDYAAARGIAIEASDAPILLTRALDWLDIRAFKGTKTDPEQETAWPRDGVPGVEYGTIPGHIVKAQLAAAVIYHEGGDPLATLGPRVTQERVEGAVSVSYSDRGPLVTLYPILQGLIAPYMDSAGGANTFKVIRI